MAARVRPGSRGTRQPAAPMSSTLKAGPLRPVRLLVDPRHDGGSQGSMERYAFRPGAFFEMPPDSGRERTERGTVGPVSLPRPAPTGVDGDPLRRDLKGVRIATDFGLVDVHLGHLAQRRAGWPAKVLTSRLLHSASGSSSSSSIAASGSANTEAASTNESVLLHVRGGLLRDSREPHRNKCNTLCTRARGLPDPAIWSARGPETRPEAIIQR